MKGIVKALPVYDDRTDLEEKSSSNPIDVLNINSLWSQGIKGENINIAVLDTGCDVTHPELDGRILGGANFTMDDNRDFSNYLDHNGHGTHVAGLVSSNNILEKIGVAPESKLLIIKVLDRFGRGDMSTLINGLYYAINWRGKDHERIRIICMSLGTKEYSQDLHEAVKFANKKGVSVIAAAGNEGDGKYHSVNYLYPGALNEVIQVGATNNSGQIAFFSNINNQIDLLAPGELIKSVYLNREYKRMSGTSMAAAIVTGSLSLILNLIEKELNRELTEPEMYAQLVKRTESIGLSFLLEGNGVLKF